MIRQRTIRSALANFGTGRRLRFKQPNYLPIALCLLSSLGAAPAQKPAASPTTIGTSGLRQSQCRVLRLTGEVAEGHEWSAQIGEGWSFRVVPIRPSSISADRPAYSGWDLVVDREKGGGYPDALLLGTPPYGSLNEREIGTTYGMRAQDAIAWEPRRFQFLTDLKDLARARELFSDVMGGVGVQPAAADAQRRNKAAKELLQMVGRSSGLQHIASGELSVLDARLKLGVSDPPNYALQWVPHLGQVPHKLDQADALPSPKGELLWFRFRITLWLPEPWKTPPGISSEMASCAQ